MPVSSLISARFFRAAGIALGLLTATAFADQQTRLDTLFEGWNGCALILTRDRHQEKLLEYGSQQCALPVSPCSTFKIPHAIIGLQEGLLTGPQHLKTWDGKIHGRTQNNQDHTLQSAIEQSVVWYFQSLARDIGPEKMAAWLQRMNYGNRDISGGMDRFWLGSSLKITGHNQLEFLKALTHETLPASPEVQSAVRNMLKQSALLPGQLYGKTGSCLGQNDEPDHGWYVGWLEHEASATNPATTWFVVNIRGAQANGLKAKAIALALLQEP